MLFHVLVGFCCSDLCGFSGLGDYENCFVLGGVCTCNLLNF